jgi:tetratricopeptide (TPR) repeat protein
MSKNIIIPENLATELFEMVTLRHSGPSLVEDVRLCLEDNLELLNKVGVFSKEVKQIRIGVTSFGSIEDGWISDNIIQNAIGKGRTEHNGSKKLIMALFIGCYRLEWRDGYCQYYNTDGTLKFTEVPDRQEKENENVQIQLFGNISFDPKKFNILILPFYNPEEYSVKTHAGDELKRRLIENSDFLKNGLDVEYFPYDDFDNTSQMAMNIGREIANINMVIWGTDSKPKDLSHQIYFHFIENYYESFNLIQEQGKTDRLEIPRLIEITEGGIYLEIEDVIYLCLVNKFYMQKDYFNCLVNLRKIITPKYINDYSYIIAADCCSHLGLFDESKEFFIEGLKINPNNLKGNNNYGFLLQNKFNDYKTAKKYFRKVIRLSPDSFLGYYNYAYSLLHSNDLEGSKKFFLKAIALAPEKYFTHSDYAWFSYFKLKDLIDAKKHCEIALDINPNIGQMHALYGLLLTELRNFEEASEHFRNAVELDPDVGEYNTLYASSLLELGKFEEAIEYYEKALEFDQEDGQEYFEYSLFLKDTLKLKQKSKQYYIKAISINSNLRRKDLDNYFGIK